MPVNTYGLKPITKNGVTKYAICIIHAYFEPQPLKSYDSETEAKQVAQTMGINLNLKFE